VTLLALAVLGRGLVSPDEPVLHADDEALLRGRAAFETLRVYGGRPFRLGAHLDRLAASAGRIGLPPLDRDGMAGLAADALAGAGAPDVALRLFWTPGREEGGPPTGLALVSALPPDLEEERAAGIKLASISGAGPRLLAGTKSTSYAEHLAARDEARRRGADDALLVADDGTVLEAPTANVWWREGSLLVTPALELPLLAGVTRAALAEYAPRLGYELLEGIFRLERMQRADEAFLSSSVREVMPVVAIDRRPIPRGDAAVSLQRALRQEALAGAPA
jgi:branched-subunit amino acid aminotransferase/4-amino-4-deoxychorismate lyase